MSAWLEEKKDCIVLSIRVVPRASKDAIAGIMEEIKDVKASHYQLDCPKCRHTIKVQVTLQPGNASELLNSSVEGVTRDISSGGLGAIFPIPTNVGDFYRLDFDRSEIDLPLSFARCVSCALVREGVYSSGFKFLQNITLPGNLEKKTEE